MFMVRKSLFMGLMLFFGFQGSALADVLAVPSGQKTYGAYAAVSNPLLSNDPSAAKPVGVGPVAEGGGTLNVRVGFEAFDGTVDIYLAAYAPAALGPDILMITQTGVQPLDPEHLADQAWMKATAGPIQNVSLFGDIAVDGLPRGEYHLYLMVSPPSDTQSFYLWSTAFCIDAGKVCAPVLSMPAGTYNQPITVDIRCSTPGTSIYYTVDGSEPSVQSNLYQGQPILISNHVSVNDDPDPTDEYLPLTTTSMTLRAIAFKEGLESSVIVGGGYIIDKVDSWFFIPYDDPPEAGGGKHKLDIYQPHGLTGTKVLFFVYGGAWKQGDKNLYFELGNTFAGYYNYTTVVINYELSCDPWNAVHPDHIQDVAKAFSWVYHNIAAYGGDPEKIYVFGQSAGGHLASLLATDGSYLGALGLSTDKIRGVISMSGVYDLYDLVKYPLNPLDLSETEILSYKALVMNAFGGWDQATLDAASPATYVKPSQPPFHIVHAWDDMAGFNQEAIDFFDLVRGMNGPYVDIVLLEESDIPPEVLAMDFDGDFDGHYQEIYAINTMSWDCRSVMTVVDFIESH
jgi:pimeloyl-ACP methyl ester carboxylesterase